MNDDSTKHEPPSVEGQAAGAGALTLAAPELLPTALTLLPVSQTTLFPGMIVPLIVPEGVLAGVVENAMTDHAGVVGVILSRDPSASVATGPTTSFTGLPAEGTEATAVPAGPVSDVPEYFPFGVAVRILKRINLPDNQVSVLVSGLQRFRVVKRLATEPFPVVAVSYIKEESTRGTETEALLRTALVQFKQLARDNPLISEEVKVALVNIDGPLKLVDFMVSILIREVSDYQDMLAASSLTDRLQHLLRILKRESDVQAVQKKIHDEINTKVGQAQREFYLNEQLRQIQKELGRSPDERSRLTEKYLSRLKDKQIPADAKTRIDEEMERLQSIPEQSSEFSVAATYVDWLTSVPWGTRSTDSLDLARARATLDRDHRGLKEVKERILEHLAVKRLQAKAAAGTKSPRSRREGSILCFVGPPGTGKTSLGRSIARALGRRFLRFSVGGMRDEAEIKGHRRTYVGAMPGKFIQGLKRAGTINPVFVIDEIDKMGTAWTSGGDPASALLELLDLEQNFEFLDHYLDVGVDATDVFFIATANSTESIPPALLDRMEVIHLSGYSDVEKQGIGRHHLIPKQLRRTGLSARDLRITESGLRLLIQRYARESGVRSLEKQIAMLCRKVALRHAMGRSGAVTVADARCLERFLGPPPFMGDKGPGPRVRGVATGLAWTAFGGDVLFVESLSTPGKGGLVLTGALGKVMQESANIAYTFVRNRAGKLGLPKGYFDENQFHLHVPAGATPKDGPSAGVTMAASLYSLLSGQPVNHRMAMTGELTLTGRVLPVGGIRDKLLAARRAGLRTVLIPRENAKDLRDVPPEVRRGLRIVRVDSMDGYLRQLFGKADFSRG